MVGSRKRKAAPTSDKVEKVKGKKGASSSTSELERATKKREEIMRLKWESRAEQREHDTNWTGRAIVWDNAFTFEGLPPEVQEIITRRGWGTLAAKPELYECNLSIVKEFYAKLQVARRDGANRGITSITVRGKNVCFGPKAINAFFSLPREGGLTKSELDTREKGNMRRFLGDVIRPFFHGNNPWPCGDMIKPGTEKANDKDRPLAHKFWGKFILAKMHPVSNKSSWPVHRTVLLHALYSEDHINVGDLIYQQILYCTTKSTKPIVYPYLIHTLITMTNALTDDIDEKRKGKGLVKGIESLKDMGDSEEEEEEDPVQDHPEELHETMGSGEGVTSYSGWSPNPYYFVPPSVHVSDMNDLMKWLEQSRLAGIQLHEQNMKIMKKMGFAESDYKTTCHFPTDPYAHTATSFPYGYSYADLDRMRETGQFIPPSIVPVSSSTQGACIGQSVRQVVPPASVPDMGVTHDASSSQFPGQSSVDGGGSVLD